MVTKCKPGNDEAAGLPGQRLALPLRRGLPVAAQRCARKQQLAGVAEVQRQLEGEPVECRSARVGTLAFEEHVAEVSGHGLVAALLVEEVEALVVREALELGRGLEVDGPCPGFHPSSVEVELVEGGRSVVQEPPTGDLLARHSPRSAQRHRLVEQRRVGERPFGRLGPR